MKLIFHTLLLCLVVWHGGLGASELASRLQFENYVLLIRHAYAPGVGDPSGYTLDRCESQRVLNEQGKRQSVQIGRWLRSQGITEARVHTSPWCRCRQTAELLNMGPVLTEPSLGSFFDQPEQASERNRRLQAFIAQALRSQNKRPLILVTHHVNIREFTGQNIDSGAMVLARVDTQGQVIDYQLQPSP